MFILSHHDISVATVAAITGKRSFSELANAIKIFLNRVLDALAVYEFVGGTRTSGLRTAHGDAIKIFLNRVPYGGAAGARLRFFLIASRRSCGAGRTPKTEIQRSGQTRVWQFRAGMKRSDIFSRQRGI